MPGARGALAHGMRDESALHINIERQAYYEGEWGRVSPLRQLPPCLNMEGARERWPCTAHSPLCLESSLAHVPGEHRKRTRENREA